MMYEERKKPGPSPASSTYNDHPLSHNQWPLPQIAGLDIRHRPFGHTGRLQSLAKKCCVSLQPTMRRLSNTNKWWGPLLRVSPASVLVVDDQV